MAEELAEGDPPARGSGFVTEEAVYGLILVAGMIIVAGSHGETSWAVFTTVVVTVLVFWAAHIYAGTLAHLNVGTRQRVELRQAFRDSVRRSSGLLVGAAIPSAILLLGTLRIVPDDPAIWIALWSEVVALAVLGYIAFLRRGATMLYRLIGAVATAGFGIIMIALKAIIH